MVMSLKLHPTVCARPINGSTNKNRFTLPNWAASSVEIGAALHIVKNGCTLDTLRLDKCIYYLFGRNPNCPCSTGSSFTLDHPTVSRQHAAIVHGDNGALFLIDLGSAHGTFYGGQKLEPFVPTYLENGKVISFGMSTRRYLVRLFPTTKSVLTGSTSCYSAPMASGDLDTTDKQTVLHTNINCLLSCLPEEQSGTTFAPMLRHRGRTRGYSLNTDLMECFAEKPKLFKSRRVSFSPEQPQIIPTEESTSTNVTEDKTNVCKTIENFLGRCNEASFKVFMDVTGLESRQNSFDKLKYLRPPLTPNSVNTIQSKNMFGRGKSASFSFGSKPMTPLDQSNTIGWENSLSNSRPTCLVNRRRTCSEMSMISPLFGNDTGVVSSKRPKIAMDMRVATPVE